MGAMSPPRILGGAAVVALVAESVAHDDVLVAAAVTAFAIVLAALLTHAARRRVEPSARPILALCFGVTAVFTTVAFWSALPFGFGAAAIASSGRAGSLASLLAAFAMIVATVFCILA